MGPRQSGKTTLVKAAFARKPYVNMEDAENRALATEDPKSFINVAVNSVLQGGDIRQH